MTKADRSKEDKKLAEAEAAAYKAAKWTLRLKLTERGGGRARMERGA